MAYRYGDRNQVSMFPPSLEDYVGPDAPVRAYDAFLDVLDLGAIGIEVDENKVGNPSYDPRAMLKILVYGYTYGVRSSRKLERETHYNVSFMWIAGGLRPDFKTISEFRRNNRLAIAKVLKQCARMCVELNLVDGNTLFVDGTKVRASASSSRNWTAKRCEKALGKIDERIKKILDKCDNVDELESGSPSLVHMNEELKNSELLKKKVQQIAADLKESGKKAINTTDPDSRVVKGSRGFMTGYNAQAGVDGKHGLIVTTDVVDSAVDANQLSGRVKDANESIGLDYDMAVADAGYFSVTDLKEVEEAGATVVVPSDDQAAGKEESDFLRDKFTYDEKRNCYTCPAGHRLGYYTSDDKKRRHRYRVTDAAVCRACPWFGTCTTNKRGRNFSRSYDIVSLEKFKRQYEQMPDVYRFRKARAEAPFGHIKRNLGARQFLLRGFAGVRAEFSLLATAYNLVRMVNIVGVEKLVVKIREKFRLQPA